jgi:hypothetical protein
LSLAPASLPDLLHAATTIAVPTGLKTALLRLGSLSSPQLKTTTATHSAKGALSGFSGAAKYVASVVFLAAAGVPLFLWLTPESIPSSIAAPTISDETSALFWNFDSPPPESLKDLKISGNLNWRVVEENGEKNGEIYGSSGLFVVFPVNLPPVPFVLETTLRQNPPDGQTFFRYGCGWLPADDETGNPMAEDLFRRPSREHGKTLFSIQYYFTQDDEIISVTEERVEAVTRSKRTQATNRLSFVLSAGGALTALRIAPLHAKESSRLAELRSNLFNVEKEYARTWHLYKNPPDLKGLTLLSGEYKWTKEVNTSGTIGALYFSDAHELNVLGLPKDCPDEIVIKCGIRFQSDKKGVHFGWLNPNDGRLYPAKDQGHIVDPYIHRLNDEQWHYYEVFLSRKTGLVGYMVDKKVIAFFTAEKIPSSWKKVINFRGAWTDFLSVEAADETSKKFWADLQHSAIK